MTRIPTVNPETASDPVRHVLDGVEKKLGGIPNIVATMANSPAVAQAYLGFSGALSGGTLSARLREQIALVVGQANSCGYCVAAHTMLGKRAGLSDDETISARRGEASSEKDTAALHFASRIVEERGFVADNDLQQVREAGYSDEEIVEIIANVALNLFTNYFNHVAGTEIDFPAVPQLQTT